MSTENSPMYAQGCADGKADRAIVEHCPPLPPVGPAPPIPAYPRMYMRGYDDEFGQATPHECTEDCQKAANYPIFRPWPDERPSYHDGV